MKYRGLVSILLRVGVALAFLYAASASFVTPTSWIGYFPEFLRRLVPAEILLPLFSIYEVLLAFWLLLGKKTVYAAGLAALSLSTIVIFNLGALDIVFRDVPIIFAVMALGVLTLED